ncbi:eCIS core domain-containing protein [Anthocerotibacter panamensis]|uniref:eCIS core domain-containing protein n=1 Tax=Anthocerotibacter panamensis TaxID=2857077 RepID=UPI001C407DA1|nr:DUF4157 domain-containing protein [Anthocerotibacter panamensis]
MVHERLHKPSSWDLLNRANSSSFAPHPAALQAQRDTQSPLTQEEQATEAFYQNQFEAHGLEIKQKYGTITPVEQEQLGVLQAKMTDFWTQYFPITRDGGMFGVQQVLGQTNPPSQNMSPVQAKLTIGQPGDQYDSLRADSLRGEAMGIEEADRVAAQVIRQIHAPISAPPTQGQAVQRQEEPEEELQAKPEITALQHEAMPEEDLQAKPTLQRREASGEASTDLESAINSARGGGQPLAAGLQQAMGQAMGADFSGVKVHTDAQSDQLNQSIQARAFTTGQDVFFRQGEYDPGSRGGQELIAHELTHVVQQNGGAVRKDQIEAKPTNSEGNSLGVEGQESTDVQGYGDIQKKSAQPFHISRDIAYGGRSVQRAIWKKIKGKWIEIVKTPDQKAEYNCPEGAKEGTFFNDVTGFTGENMEDVQPKPPLYGNACPLFYKLYNNLIILDDRKEPSEIDIKWKQKVISNRNNEGKLEELSKDVPIANTLVNSGDKPPEPKFRHGEIGTFEIDDPMNKKRLETHHQLFNPDEKERKKAVEIIRGTDSKYSSYQGAIHRSFIEEERKAILGLVAASKGAKAVFSLERGGSIIADLIEKLANIERENIKVPKPNEQEVGEYLDKRTNLEKELKEVQFEGRQKRVQQEKFKDIIVQYIKDHNQDTKITIAIAETAVGGGSVNKLVELVKDICEMTKDLKTPVKFRILVARETIKYHGRRGQGIVKLTDEVPETEQGRKEKAGIKSGPILETDDSKKVEIYISELRYLIGEDVDYQAQYSGGINANRPVIVFEDNGQLTAMRITPAPSGGDTARDIIMDLVAGAYDQVMEEYFPK